MASTSSASSASTVDSAMTSSSTASAGEGKQTTENGKIWENREFVGKRGKNRRALRAGKRAGKHGKKEGTGRE